MGELAILDYLDKLGIIYRVFKHPPFRTCDEAKEYRLDMKGAHAKTLFLKSKKGENFYMVIISCDERLDIKKFADVVGEKVVFASAEDLDKILYIKPGAVSPLALVHDKLARVHLIIDKDIWHAEIVDFHPGVNTKSLEMEGGDFKKFVSSLKNTLLVF